MKKKTLILATVFIICSTALAEKQLERSEILEIFSTLTQSPQKTWIPAGTIEAAHEEYRAAKTTDANEINTRIAEEELAYQDNPDKVELTPELQAMRLEAIPFNVSYKLSNQYTMNSTVVVRYDGDKFYWETNVDSRINSVIPTSDLTGNFLTEEFDLNSNQKKVFAWNGQRYTTYFRPVNHAIVTTERSGVNGPLTAGVVAWGYGRYSLANLSSADLSGLETEVDGQKEIELIVVRDGREEAFTLDPAKNYALKKYSADLPNNVFVLQVYGNYQLAAGKWCPGNILIERYDKTITPDKLTARDVWDFTSISSQTPPADSYNVAYEFDAFIEDFSLGDEPLQYHYSAPPLPSSKNIDTDELLMQRLLIASADSKQNCASASLKYVCDKLGVNQSFTDLTKLVHGREKTTTLLQMQQYADSIGLNSAAVKTDIQTLKDLGDYQVIVHLPQQNHFVVLGEMDGRYVRLIDLSSNRFYYRQSIERFNSVWDGTAMLVTKGSVSARGNLAKIDNGSLKRIVGACSGEQCTTSCSSSGDSGCVEVAGDCGGHTITFSRTCCGSAESGNCSESSMIYKKHEDCETDPIEGGCEGQGDWESFTMQACG